MGYHCQLVGSQRGLKITFDTIGGLSSFPSRYCDLVQSVSLSLDIELATLLKCRNLRNLELGYYGDSETTYNLQALVSFTALHRLYIYGDCSHAFGDIGIIAECRALRDFSMICSEDLCDLGVLEFCRDLSSLSLSNCESISRFQLSDLRWCQALVSLDIDHCIHVDGIPTLPPTLQHLSMHWCGEVTSIDFLTMCAALESLNMRGCMGITDIEPLPLSIRRLDMRDCPGITCIDRLSSCHSLQSLKTSRGSLNIFALLPSSIESLTIELPYASGGDGVFSLHRPGSFRALRSLSLSRCAVISSLEPLPVENLLQLKISHCGDIADITPLASCVALRELVLGDMQSLESLAPLASCNALHRLELSNLPGVKSLQPLAECESLCDLTLQRMRGITSLAPLVEVVSLTKLILRAMTSITSVEALARCTSLHALVLDRCHSVFNIESLALCPALRILKVQRCGGLNKRTIKEIIKGKAGVGFRVNFQRYRHNQDVRY